MAIGWTATTGAATSGAVDQSAHFTAMTFAGTLNWNNSNRCPGAPSDDLARIGFEWGIGAFTTLGPTENSAGLLGFGFFDAGVSTGANFFLGGGNVGYSNPSALNSDVTYQFRSRVDIYLDSFPSANYQCTRYGAQVNFKTNAVDPTASAPTSSLITSGSATIACNFRANTAESSCSAQLQYKRAVDSVWINAGAPAVTSGYGAQSISRDLFALTAATLYDFRLVLTRTTNNSTTLTSSVGQFTTGAAGPTIVTAPASGFQGTSAVLNGVVNPNGAATSYYFDWGLTPALGTITAAQGPTSGTSPLAYSQLISGLTPNTIYYFRAHAFIFPDDYVGATLSFSTDTQGHIIMPTIYSRFGKYGTALDVYFTVETPSATGSDRMLSAPVTWVAGDAIISKDGGAFANVSSLPARVGSTPLYKWSATAGEMTANDVNMLLVDLSPAPSWRDLHINIQTRLLLGQIDVDATQIGGNTSAMSLVGVGTGYGLFAKGSSGIRGEAQGTSGHGIVGVGIGPGQGVQGVAGATGAISNFLDTSEGAAELTPGDLTDSMTFGKILKLLKVREAHKLTQTSNLQVWYKKDSATILASRTVSDDLTTQTQAKLY